MNKERLKEIIATANAILKDKEDEACTHNLEVFLKHLINKDENDD